MQKRAKLPSLLAVATAEAEDDDESVQEIVVEMADDEIAPQVSSPT
jgi:hypothetical protein